MSNKIELSLAKSELGLSVEKESLACSFRRCCCNKCDSLWNFTLTALTESQLMNGIALSKTRREEHLKGTAELAALFAAEFGCGEWERLERYINDLKYSI